MKSWGGGGGGGRRRQGVTANEWGEHVAHDT